MNVLHLPAEDVAAEGFSQFNAGTHTCIDLPDGHHTISVRQSNGRCITFAFVPYTADGPAGCVDIHDAGGKEFTPEMMEPSHLQKIIAFAGGGTAFRASDDTADAKAVTLTTLILAD